MSVERKKSKETTTLTISGDLTIYSVAQLKDEILNDLENLEQQVALDLQSVSEIDTAGIQLLLFTQKHFLKHQKHLYLAKSNEVVDSVLTTFDLQAAFAKG